MTHSSPDSAALAGKVERIAHMMRKLLADLPFCDPDIKDLEQAAAALRAPAQAAPRCQNCGYIVTGAQPLSAEAPMREAVASANLGAMTHALSVAIGRVDALEKATRDACDLLAERTYGSDARSPGHNARILLERAVAAEDVLGAQPQAATQSSPPAATTGDIPPGSRPPASAAMGQSAGGEAIFDECAEIALEHVGAYSHKSIREFVSDLADEACRDIADAIKLRASNRKVMDALVPDVPQGARK